MSRKGKLEYKNRNYKNQLDQSTGNDKVDSQKRLSRSTLFLFLFFLMCFIGYQGYRYFPADDMSANPIASFTINQKTTSNSTLEVDALPFYMDIRNESENAAEYIWRVSGENMDTMFVGENQFQFPFRQIGKYKIELQVESQDGEMDTKEIRLSLSFSDSFQKRIEGELMKYLTIITENGNNVERKKAETYLKGLFNNQASILLTIDGSKETLTSTDFFNKIKRFSNQIEKKELVKIELDKLGKVEEVTVKLDLNMVNTPPQIALAPPIKSIPQKVQSKPIPSGTLIPKAGTERPLPIVDFKIDGNRFFVNKEIYFENQTKNASKVVWDFNGDGKVDSRQESAKYTFSKIGEYQVQLQVFDENNELINEKKETIRIELSESELTKLFQQIAERGNNPTKRNSALATLVEGSLKSLCMNNNNPKITRVKKINGQIASVNSGTSETLVSIIKNFMIKKNTNNTKIGNIQVVGVNYDWEKDQVTEILLAYKKGNR